MQTVDNKVPVVGGSLSTLSAGSIATCCYDNKATGTATAELVIRVVKNGEKAGEIPVSQPPKVSLYINETAAKMSQLTLPVETVTEAESKF